MSDESDMEIRDIQSEYIGTLKKTIQKQRSVIRGLMNSQPGTYNHSYWMGEAQKVLESGVGL